MCVWCVCARVRAFGLGDRRRVLNPLSLDFQVVVSRQLWYQELMVAVSSTTISPTTDLSTFVPAV